jgi:hypothetical protein
MNLWQSRFFMGLRRQDFVSGVRSLSRSPAFAAIFVISIAVGIGAATSVFTLLNALVLRPLPLPHPEQLVQVTAIYRNHSRIPISYPMFTELEREQRAFSGICGWTAAADFNVETNGKMTLSDVRSVTGGYYTVLGVHPLLGRLINPSDVQGSQVAQVAVISYEVWNHRFAADPAIVGKTMRIEGKLFTIIGVTQRWFTGMTIGSPPEITIPARCGTVIRHAESLATMAVRHWTTHQRQHHRARPGATAILVASPA